MAAKKKAEEAKVTEEVVEDVEVEEIFDEDTETEETVKTESTEKEEKVGPIKGFFRKKKADFKEHPVKETGKLIGGAVVTVLTVIGGRTVYKAIADNSEITDVAIDLIEDKAEDVVETISE